MERVCVLVGAAAVLLLMPCASSALKLPSYIKSCSRNLTREEMNVCALKSARETMPHVINGDRTYKVPVLDPLKIDKLQVDDGHGPLGLAFLASDISITGMKDIRIDLTDIDLHRQHVVYVAYVPRLEVICHYNISGKILLLPIVGEGKGNITMDNFIISYTFDFTLEKGANGQEYFIPNEDGKIDFNTTRIYIQLDNLFNGDKLLGESTNKFLNENWEETKNSIGPIVSESIGAVVRQILSSIFSLVPMDEAFPIDKNKK